MFTVTVHVRKGCTTKPAREISDGVQSKLHMPWSFSLFTFSAAKVSTFSTMHSTDGMLVKRIAPLGFGVQSAGVVS